MDSKLLRDLSEANKKRLEFYDYCPKEVKFALIVGFVIFIVRIASVYFIFPVPTKLGGGDTPVESEKLFSSFFFFFVFIGFSTYITSISCIIAHISSRQILF